MLQLPNFNPTLSFSSKPGVKPNKIHRRKITHNSCKLNHLSAMGKNVHNYEKVYLIKSFIRLAPRMGGQLMFRPNHPQKQSAFATEHLASKGGEVPVSVG
jgi:hypothetical protein